MEYQCTIFKLHRLFVLFWWHFGLFRDGELNFECGEKKEGKQNASHSCIFDICCLLNHSDSSVDISWDCVCTSGSNRSFFYSKCSICHTSVSYTHLDVYKRQKRNCVFMNCSKRWRSFEEVSKKSIDVKGEIRNE